MKMLQIVCLCLASILLSACAKKAPPPPVVKDQKVERVNKTFSAVDVDGNINVVLKSLRKGSNVVLQGDSRDLPYVTTEIKDGKVFIMAPHAPKYGPITAVVSVTQLNHFAFSGDGNVSGKGLRASMMDMQLFINGKVDLSGKLGIRDLSVTGTNKITLKGVSSRNLNISMNGDVDVKMQGVANLQTMKYSGKGKLALHWVDSPDLEVMGFGEAKVHLAGVARYFHAVTHDKSLLDARYLRVEKAYVKARDFSMIRLTPVNEFNAYATEHGRIYYYEIPKAKIDFMAQNGSVLNFVRYK